MEKPDIITKVKECFSVLGFSEKDQNKLIRMGIAGFMRKCGRSEKEIEKILGIPKAEAKEVWAFADAVEKEKDSPYGYVDVLPREGIMVEIEKFSDVPVIHVAESEEVARRLWRFDSIKGVLVPAPLAFVASNAISKGYKLALYGSAAWIKRAKGPIAYLVAREFDTEILSTMANLVRRN